jgi:Zn-dependent peptidase ImmA (M78 family)
LYNLRVPWLSKKSIAAAAGGVIACYEAIVKRRVQPPIPVENIIERGLDLRLGFADLRKSLKLDDVLGATFVKKKMICVDRSLAENQNEGRLCFTFAHETGHWVLHRKLVDQACRTFANRGITRLRPTKPESTGLAEFVPELDQSTRPDDFGAVSPIDFEPDMGGSIFCRVKDAKEPIEWQADYFASCLLMPEADVRDAFGQCFGSRPLILYNVKSAYSGPVCFDPCVETWPRIADAVRDAGGFSNVSRQAMIIRLQDLGLVKNETRSRLSWKEITVTA